jgi:FHA domain-containing protein
VPVPPTAAAPKTASSPTPASAPAPATTRSPAPAPASIPTSNSPPTDPTNAAWLAFCEGAGVPIDACKGSTAEIEALRAAGTLLRATIEGMLRLMNMRATTRSELHADVTMIRSKNNNPLKFSPDAQSAIEQLLRPPLRGFMPGPVAITSAMNDLVSHGVGTMTGTRAALDGVLARFAPQQLEARLASKSMLNALLPMNRKAKLWELYLERYEGIRDEAHDNFHELFGKDFLTAYQRQVEQLQGERTIVDQGSADAR